MTVEFSLKLCHSLRRTAPLLAAHPATLLGVHGSSGILGVHGLSGAGISRRYASTGMPAHAMAAAASVDAHPSPSPSLDEHMQHTDKGSLVRPAPNDPHSIEIAVRFLAINTHILGYKIQLF